MGATCLFCGGKQVQPQFEMTDLWQRTRRIVQCQSCKLEFLDPQPSDEELKQAYAEDYYGEGETKFHPALEKLIQFFRKGRARRVYQFSPKADKVLDIGCGNGQFLGFVAEEGSAISGVELPGKAAQRAALIPNIDLRTKPLEPGDFEPATFDVVTMWHVFEHVPNPKQILSTVHDILKPGGFFMVSVPNPASWQARWFKGHWFHWDPPRHLFLWGAKALVEHFEGFELKEIKHFSLEQNPYGYVQSLLNSWGFPREELYESLKGHRSGKAKALWFQKLVYYFGMPFFGVVSLLEAFFRRGGTIEMVFQKKTN